MISIICALSLALASQPHDSTPADAAIQTDTEITSSLVLKVQNKDQTAEELLARAASIGGYFSSRTNETIVLKIPTLQASEFVEQTKSLGMVVTSAFSNADLTSQIAEARARLQAREEMLTHYFSILENASSGSIVTVERQIVQLVSEIESLKGTIRMLEYKSTYATVTISFQFRDRAAPNRDGNSSFQWLNTLNLSDMVNDFRHGFPSRASQRNRSTEILPSGFAPYTIRREQRAVSPDGVLFRVRSERHHPKAELPFWEAAVQTRMIEAGYILVSQHPMTDQGGTLLEWAAPMGNDDYSYIIGIFPRGKSLVIVEAAGEVTRFNGHRDAIFSALESL